MSEAERIVLTAATTILGGLIAVVAGQLASRFFVEPWYEQRKVIGSIAEAQLNYAYLFAESGSVLPEVPDAVLRVRQLSTDLLARTISVPGYHVLASLNLAPSLPAIRDASRGLWRLSNALGDPKEWKLRVLDASRIALALGIEDI
jgi:hypothetical protein